MLKTASILPLVFAVAAFGLTLAHAWQQPASTATQTVSTSTQPAEPTNKSTADVLATVNGTPIHEADVSFALTRAGHNLQISPEQRKTVLENIIRRELVYQRAVELGLDADTRYQEKLRQMEAQINAFKREELSNLFFSHEIAGRAAISEADAKKYFDENAARIQTELHVWQILSRNESFIEQARKDLQQGASFEEVAGRRFGNLPESVRTPWDLGYLRWNQVPGPWQDVVYGLKTGEVSGVIRGPNNRFWIIKLIDRRKSPEITFESMKSTIMAVLKNAKIEELREETYRDLRAKADIVYSNPPVAKDD